MKAAPNPHATYGETVCVAGLRLDLEHPGWVRLYPVVWHLLRPDQRFAKYDVVALRAKPSRRDPRIESWLPDLPSITVEGSIQGWRNRLSHVIPFVGDSMCEVLEKFRTNPPARSLAAVRSSSILDVNVEHHPGWSEDEQSKIAHYLRHPDLDDTPRVAPKAPRMRGWYRYRCQERTCGTHRQQILDEDWVIAQRKWGDIDDAELAARLRQRFRNEMCGDDRDVIFFVGNQAKRQQAYSVLGVFCPPRHPWRPTGRRRW
ncbi:hypothetical protein [Streptoalloteichus tenebrarius]|uniref:hypothetical protein n=1 Tax=Streptoalloteichus tenebrarius (strain ATCC 17920 / DSM 40477 / JCM 4838 / CBS 697.72 / NBRC 16177 / NCIMB 11028 / NRRL B-12390 / A12253. 1 / ISP 5477) TaxID=1933 RepID=UPI0035E9F905